MEVPEKNCKFIYLFIVNFYIPFFTIKTHFKIITKFIRRRDVRTVNANHSLLVRKNVLLELLDYTKVISNKFSN